MSIATATAFGAAFGFILCLLAGIPLKQAFGATLVGIAASLLVAAFITFIDYLRKRERKPVLHGLPPVRNPMPMPPCKPPAPSVVSVKVEMDSSEAVAKLQELTAQVDALIVRTKTLQETLDKEENHRVG